MRRDYKKHRKTIILFALGIVCCFSIGYAAFSQNFLVSGKGTVVVPETPITPDKLIEKTVTTGDGLYEDTTEEGRYIYRGENPDNYIIFNGETKPWRIMSLDKEENTNKYNLKIIRNESIGHMPFDSNGFRDSESNGAGGTYCSKNSTGCNAWGVSDNFVNETLNGTVLKNAELNIYLNTTYLQSIKEDSKYIIEHNFNVGPLGNTSDIEDIATNIQKAALYKWNGKIGLMNVTDILKTTTDSGCVSLKVGYNSGNKSICSNSNWMWTKSGYEWTISPYSETSGSIWTVYSNGFIGGGTTSIDSNNNSVRPVLYLDSNIKLTGEGTETNPYTIVNS